MSRDYKDAGSKKAPAKKGKKPAATPSKPPVEKPSSGLSTGAAMFFGLAIGLGVAALVYYKLKPAEKGASQPAPVVEVKPASKSRNKPEVEEEESRFDFYSILPKLEVIIPDQEVQEESSSGHTKSTGEKKKLAPIEKPGSYILQAGSFKNAADADKVKASLALLGVQPHIETVTINGSDTWHRVRVGPFSNTKQLNKIRNRLLDNGIDVIVLRVKS